MTNNELPAAESEKEAVTADSGRDAEAAAEAAAETGAEPAALTGAEPAALTGAEPAALTGADAPETAAENEAEPECGADVDEFAASPVVPGARPFTEKEAPETAKDYDSPVWIAAAMTCLAGIVCIVHPIYAREAANPQFFSAFIPYNVYHWSKSLIGAFGFMLIYLAANLMWKKRNAWIIALALNLVSAFVLLGKVGTERLAWVADHDLAMMVPSYSWIPPALAAAFLIAFRDRFNVRSEPRSLRRGFLFAGLSIVCSLIYGTLGFFLLEERDFGLNFELHDAVTRTFKQFLFVGNPDLHPQSPFGVWFLDSLNVIGALTSVFALWSLFRPLEYKYATQPRERALAQAALDKYGCTALDHYKIMDDKSYFFASDYNSFVAYRVASGVAISLGDPIAAPEEMKNITHSFVDKCHRSGWRVAFMQTTDANLEMYRGLGLQAVKVGEDAIVDLNTFVSKTVSRRSFKAAVKKFEKDGYSFKKHVPPHAPELVSELRSVSDAWLSLPGRRERGFSLSYFKDDDLQKNNVYTVNNAQGKIVAFVNQVRSYAPGQVSIDMMRHGGDSPSGVMDFLFAKLLVSLKDDGFESFSLGLAALSGVGEKPDDSLQEKAMHQIYEHLNSFFSYKGLRAYKSKFDPTWESRYLIYEGGTPGLVRTAIAINQVAEVTDD